MIYPSPFKFWLCCMLISLLRVGLLLFIFFYSTAYSLQEQFEIWPTISLIGSLNPDWQYNLNIQGRTIPDKNKIQQSLYIPSIGYQLQPKLLIFWFGYTYTTTDVDEDAIIAGQEQRPWQRLDWSIKLSPHIQWLLGSRIEERKEANFSAWAYRWREKATLSFPHILGPKVTPTFSNEIFLNLNQPEWVSQTFFEQNRFYAGFNFLFNHYVSLDLGYLNQYQFRDPENQMDNVLFLQLNINHFT